MEYNEDNIKINIIKDSGVWKKTYFEYHLIFVLNGHIRIRLKRNNCYLNEQDVILYSPGESVNYFGGKKCLILDIEMDVLFLENYIPVHEGIFVCNSATDKQHDYSPIQKIMAKLAITYLKKTETSQIYFNSLAYMLIYILRENHFEKNLVSVPNINEKYQDRVNEILMFIQKNYKKAIHLEQMADELHLSVSYLSRFFKKAFKTNFVDYIKIFRLERAQHQILYTKQSITEIALQSGFSSSSVFIQCFKGYYGYTPGMYRKMYMLKHDGESRTHVEQIKQEELIPFLSQLTDNKKLSGNNFTNTQKDFHYIIDAKSIGTAVVPLWKNGIGIAAANHMPFNDISSEIEEIQKDVGFKYGRVSFLMSTAFIYDGENNNYNFYYFTRMIQEMKKYGLIPYLDINYNCIVDLQEKECAYYVDTKEFLGFIEALLLYSANVFGIAELEKWIFDIGIIFNFNTQICEKTSHFLERFIGAYKIIKRIVPKAKVGGFDLCSVFMEEHCKEILSSLIEKKIIPDFISVNVFPYISYTNLEKPKYVYTLDNHFPVNDVKKFKDIVRHYFEPVGKIPQFFVSAIGTTLAHRNYINDTCYQSSFIAQIIVYLVGEIDLLCYYQLSDMNFSSYENQRLLAGRNGLISQFGIHKPGYLIFQMMTLLSNRLIAKGDNYMVTKGEHNIYQILLYNPVKISDSYCLRIDENTSLPDAYTVYDIGESQSITFTLNHVTDGTYRIISYHLNRDNGSLFDEWEKTGFWENPNNYELNYLRQAMHPKRNCSTRRSLHGQLNFHINVMPFEVILLEAALIVNDQKEPC